MADVDLPYQVVWSERNREIVRNLGRKSIALGLGEEFIDDVRYIEQMLRTNPLGWGDPYFRLKVTGELLCHRIHGLLHVYYAVDEKEHLVFIKDVVAMPGGALEG